MNLQKLISLAALTATFTLVGPMESQAETTGPESDASIYFVAPAANAYFPEAPAIFDAEIAVSQGQLVLVSTVELIVDDVSYGILDCAEGCTFEDIELDLGVHSLRVEADTGAQDSVLVYVGEEPPSDTGEDDTTESGGESEDDTGESEEDTGESDDELGEDTGDTAADDGASESGCSVDASPSSWGLLAMPILLLIGAGRRRD
jgi:MYXO-CTERM domain-containing protein